VSARDSSDSGDIGEGVLGASEADRRLRADFKGDPQAVVRKHGGRRALRVSWVVLSGGDAGLLAMSMTDACRPQTLPIFGDAGGGAVQRAMDGWRPRPVSGVAFTMVAAGVLAPRETDDRRPPPPPPPTSWMMLWARVSKLREGE
jgi:hypothetical protein